MPPPPEEAPPAPPDGHYATQSPNPRDAPWCPLVISAPFGNYIQPEGCTATLGTFTAMPRGGRLIQIVKTVRYYPRIKAWVNRIGLRNPGIVWLEGKVRVGKIDAADKLVSIHGFDEPQWIDLLDRTAALKPLGVELNMSCPNVGEVSWPGSLFSHAHTIEQQQGVPVVVKLPPVNFAAMAEAGIDAGLTRFHCCNTLPVPAGGVSGGPLKPVAMQCVAEMRRRFGDRVHLLAGGGIRQPRDVDDYRAVGADTFAIGTKVMNPWYLLSDEGLRPLRDRASAA